jgi:hypothetical protein
MIVVVPADSAVTIPDAFTVATIVLVDDHVTVPVAMDAPF